MSLARSAHYAFPVQRVLNINSLLGKDIQSVLREIEGSLNWLVRGGLELLHDNWHFWRGIAREGWPGILMQWLDVRGILGYMVFVSIVSGENTGAVLQGAVPVVQERHTSRTMLDGITHHQIRRPVRMSASGYVSEMD
jgi:hypothetical protein